MPEFDIDKYISKHESEDKLENANDLNKSSEGFSVDSYIQKHEPVKKKDSEKSESEEKDFTSLSPGFRTVAEKGEELAIKYEKTPEDTFKMDSDEEVIQRQKEDRIKRDARKLEYQGLLNEVIPEVETQLSELTEKVNQKSQELGDFMRARRKNEEPEEYKRLYKELEELDKKHRGLTNVNDLLKSSKKHVETADAGVLVSALKSPLGKDFISLGLTEIERGVDVLKVAKAIERGESVSKEESMALFAYGLKQQIESDIDKGMGALVGSGVSGTIPFMVQFALTGGASAAGKKAAKEAVESMLKKSTKSTLNKIAANTVGSLTGAAVRTPLMSDFYSGAVERQIGVITPEIKDDGTLTGAAIKETQESPLEAIGKSFASTMVTSLTEDFGKYGDKLFGAIKNKIAPNAMTNRISNKTLSNIKNATGFQSWRSEFSEEIIEAYGQAAVTGDQKLSDVWDNREMLATFFTTGIISGTFSAANVVLKGDVNERVDVVGDLNKAIENINLKTQSEIDKILKGDDTYKNASQLDTYIKDKISDGANSEDVKNIVDYAVQRQRTDAMNESEQSISTKKAETDEKIVQEKVDEETKVDEESDVKDTKKEDVSVKEEVLEDTSKEDVQSSVETEKKPSERETASAQEKVEAKITPETKTEIKKPKEDAKEQQSRKMREKRVKEKVKEVSDKDLPKIDRPSIQDRKEKSVKKIGDIQTKKEEDLIRDSESIEELDTLFSAKKMKVSKEYQEKKQELRKEGRFEDKNNRVQEINIQLGIPQDLKSKLAQRIKSDKPKEQQMGFSAAIPLLDIGKITKQVSDITRRMLRADRGLPKGILKIIEEYESRQRGRLLDIERKYKQVTSSIRSKLGRKLLDEDFETIQVALENLGRDKQTQEKALNILSRKLPAEIMEDVMDLRSDIDSYSKELMKSGILGADSKENFDKNLGYYVTRTYKAHTDKTWDWDNIPDKIKLDAAESIRKDYDNDAFRNRFVSDNIKEFKDSDFKEEGREYKDLTQEGKEHYDDILSDYITGEMKSMLLNQDISGSVIKKGQSITSIDKGTLKRRSQYLTDHPEVREFMGENRDPFYNYAVSMSKMSQMIEKSNMHARLVEHGVENGWLSTRKSADKNHVSKITSTPLFKGTDYDLSKFYTTPEISETLSSFFQTSSITNPILNKLYRGWMKMVTTVKLSKTAGSFAGIVRNFLSNISNAMVNANYNVDQIATEVKKIKKEGWADFHRELVYKGIIGDNINVAEITKNVQEISDMMSSFSKDKKMDGSKARDFMLKAYSFGDDFWKTYRYISEYARRQKAYSGLMSDMDAKEQAKSESVDILHRTSTYYSRLPLFIQNLRKLPIANTFISFPYLTFTNYVATIDIALKEMKDPSLRHIGIQRLITSTTFVGSLAIMAGVWNMTRAGQDDEDMKDWRRFLAPFWKNDIILLDEVKDGKANYTNLSFMDYYGVVTTPISMIARDAIRGDISDETLVEATTDYIKNFIGLDIFYETVNDILRNQDSQTGAKIYTKTSELDVKARDMMSHLWKAVEPGTMTDIKRITRTAREGGDWKRQAMGMLGTKKRTIDPVSSMKYYKIPQYIDGLQGAASRYKKRYYRFEDVVNKKEYDYKKLKKDKKIYEDSVNSIIEDMKKDVLAMMNLGIDFYKISTLFKEAKFGLSKSVKDAVLYDIPYFIDDDGKIISR